MAMNWLKKKVVLYFAQKETEKVLMQTKNWKTTTWGVIAIVATLLGAVVHYHQTGQIDVATLYGSVVGIATGAGLIHAADGKSSTNNK